MSVHHRRLPSLVLLLLICSAVLACPIPRDDDDFAGDDDDSGQPSDDDDDDATAPDDDDATSDDDDDATGDDDDATTVDCPKILADAVVVMSDGATSTLVAVDPSSGDAAGPTASIDADDVGLAAGGGHTFALLRDEAEVHRFACSDLAAGPDSEVSLGSGSRPHSGAWCSDRLFVSLYGTSEVAVIDAAGDLLPSIDLSSYAEDGGDGGSEPAQMTVDGSTVRVVLERLDSGTGAWDETSKLVSIDCDTLDVVADHDLPRAARVRPDPSSSGNLLVSFGAPGVADGGIARYDLGGGGLDSSWLLSGASESSDIPDFAATGNFVVYGRTILPAGTAGVACINLGSNEIRDALAGWPVGIRTVRAAPGAEAWIFFEPAEGGDGLYGIGVVDVTKCSVLNAGMWWDYGSPATDAVFP